MNSDFSIFTMDENQNNEIIEHVFRHEYGKIIALLTHKYGPSNIEKIEDSVQEALLKAMQVWAFQKIPKNPTSWLLKVSGNKLIDRLRKDKKKVLQNDFTDLKTGINIGQNEFLLNNTINDSQLKMIFACCNPVLSVEYQLILSLKLVSGFSNKEISKILLKKEETIAKSATRAKKKFKEQVKTLDIPIEMGLSSRVKNVLKVIYLMFSEGYKANFGEIIIKRDICFESIRLALLLLENKNTKSPEVYALISLMCFHASRFDARIDQNNELVDLEHQDRNKYNRKLIALGIEHLELATNERKTPSSYHLQAAVSYYHCVAPNFKKTDWKSILHLYDLQLKQNYSPILELNRIIPFFKLYGAEKGLIEIKKLDKKSTTLKNSLYYSIKSEIYNNVNDTVNFKIAINKAIKLTRNEMEKKYLIKKLKLRTV